MHTTRRDFLHISSAAASAALLPSIIPSSACGADGEIAPSNRITLALIGMGKMMWGHLNSLLGRKDVQIVAICDVETLRLDKCAEKINSTYSERFGENYSGVRVYRDFRELVSQPDIDGVVIATQTSWHAIQSVEAMKAGKDVYCEKPLALTVREAEAIKAAAKRYGRIFQTGSQQRSDYKFRFSCELVRNGAIGKIKEVCVNVGGPAGPCLLPAQPIPATLDWDMWLGPCPYRPYNETLCPLDDHATYPQWRRFYDYCGGSMYDFGAHHFDIAQWGLGMDHTQPVRVIPPSVSDNGRLTYIYANGIPITRGGATGKAAIEFIGENGTVGVNRGFMTSDPEDLMKLKWGPSDIRLYESKDQKSNWLDGIRTRRSCICTADIGCSTITLCSIGNIAARLNRELDWDPDKSQFVNDPEADRLLFRSLRSPWTITI